MNIHNYICSRGKNIRMDGIRTNFVEQNEFLHRRVMQWNSAQEQNTYSCHKPTVTEWNSVAKQSLWGKVLGKKQGWNESKKEKRKHFLESKKSKILSIAFSIIFLFFLDSDLWPTRVSTYSFPLLVSFTIFGTHKDDERSLWVRESEGMMTKVMEWWVRRIKDEEETNGHFFHFYEGRLWRIPRTTTDGDFRACFTWKIVSFHLLSDPGKHPRFFFPLWNLMIRDRPGTKDGKDGMEVSGVSENVTFNIPDSISCLCSKGGTEERVAFCWKGILFEERMMRSHFRANEWWSWWWPTIFCPSRSNPLMRTSSSFLNFHSLLQKEIRLVRSNLALPPFLVQWSSL